MYAIVDIETTGSYAANNGITELAIVLYDGRIIVDRYETLINPGVPIPRYIQALTGIDDAMVAAAPRFAEVAAEVYGLLRDAVFVAHNVNFDYSFLKHHLEAAGFALNTKKLCTVRLGRKLFPGLPGYSLGKLCRSLEIDIAHRHRAGGDADATAELFSRILARDTQGHVAAMLKGRSAEQYLPPNLPADRIRQLPYTAGVYYFHDVRGKVVYVGKAKNLKNRVCSHFSNNSPSLRKQEFLRNIHDLSWQECGTELMAFLLECVEIKRLWPQYNRSLKRFEPSYGLYCFEDRNGYLRLAIEKHRRSMTAYHRFNGLVEGMSLLRSLVREFRLCDRLCFLQGGEGACEGVQQQRCGGACTAAEPSGSYNSRVALALRSLEESRPSFALEDAGRHLAESSCILIEKGEFYGMGYIDKQLAIADLQTLKEYLTPYPANDYMRGLVFQFADRWPHKKKVLP